ncbi:ABC transporter permease [Litorilinea aerophila]|uniref:ABC transporter permease n=1 Tax=Litorilinea aerophila TaxID=1204385 RepID=A0A540VET9_9CHLR|nr:ABC transporter permease [Litorilinea aerophila]MCC9077022.1 ABC transporter permease [Litorilinea aerophila]OUC06643.1 ABC transporter permease [Litorilinea aerophila]GIV76770.1 MAG: alkaline phosphatase [Litorilinea sp.]
MTRYILGRLLSLLFVVIMVSMITFSLMHAVPGGPFDEGKQPLPPAAKANIMRKYGLDKPVWQQYLNYMKNALRFDFGIPYQQPTTTVAELIAKTWKITAQVGALTVFLAFSLGITLGIIAAYHQNSWIDNAVTFMATLGIVMPNFVIGTLAILLFAVYLDWLPMGGWSDSTCLVGRYFCTDWIMPVVAYALAPMAIIARYTRASVVEYMHADFVRTARAKGLGERSVMLRHVLRNAMIPLVTVAGPIIPDLMTGSIFIESIFRIPGLGKYFVTSTFNRDYPMIMATILLIAVLWGLVYLLTDIVYTWIDPRVRLGAQEGQ